MRKVPDGRGVASWTKSFIACGIDFASRCFISENLRLCYTVSVALF